MSTHEVTVCRLGLRNIATVYAVSAGAETAYRKIYGHGVTLRPMGADDIGGRNPIHGGQVPQFVGPLIADWKAELLVIVRGECYRERLEAAYDRVAGLYSTHGPPEGLRAQVALLGADHDLDVAAQLVTESNQAYQEAVNRLEEWEKSISRALMKRG